MRTIWNDYEGTAYRPRHGDGTKMKDRPYESFRPILQARHGQNKGNDPLPPRVSRKGNVISGTLPRLAGRY